MGKVSLKKAALASTIVIVITGGILEDLRLRRQIDGLRGELTTVQTDLISELTYTSERLRDVEGQTSELYDEISGLKQDLTAGLYGR